MKILFVCQQYIHAARWIGQLKDSGHEIYVFDCLDSKIHPELLWTNYITNWDKRKIPYLKGEFFLKKKLPSLYNWLEPYLKVTASEKLEEIIKEIKPDLVHSLEMQSQTYQLIKVREKIDFKWAYFSWGSDLFWYREDKIHQKKIKQVFSNLNYFFIDNHRDIKLAQDFNFKGKIMPVFPGGGGYHLDNYREYKKSVSERNLILIKGYHHWVGRALFVLEALELMIETIQNYDIYVYSAQDIVVDKIKEINLKYNLNIKYSSRKKEITHQELLEKFGSSKIAIGNNVSDGIPNTLLEAIVMDVFPIQSNPGDVSVEIIDNEKNGLLIDNPSDIDEIKTQVLKAIEFDKEGKFIESIEINKRIVNQRLDYITNQQKIVALYQKIENSSHE